MYKEAYLLMFRASLGLQLRTRPFLRDKAKVTFRRRKYTRIFCTKIKKLTLTNNCSFKGIRIQYLVVGQPDAARPPQCVEPPVIFNYDNTCALTVDVVQHTKLSSLETVLNHKIQIFSDRNKLEGELPQNKLTYLL